jgi:hypothetical protein
MDGDGQHPDLLLSILSNPSSTGPPKLYVQSQTLERRNQTTEESLRRIDQI